MMEKKNHIADILLVVCVCVVFLFLFYFIFPFFFPCIIVLFLFCLYCLDKSATSYHGHLFEKQNL